MLHELCHKYVPKTDTATSLTHQCMAIREACRAFKSLWWLEARYKPGMRWYTTIENPSYFFMKFSCTEAIQSFIISTNIAW